MDKINYDLIIENENEREFYEATHDKILNFVNQNSPTTIWQIIRSVQGSDRRVLRLLNQMIVKGELDLKESKIYSKRGKSRNDIDEVICSSCKGRIIILKDRFKKIKNIMNKLYRSKPRPTFLFDQRPVTLETTVRRAAYLFYRGDLKDKKIAIIGDDDLTSLAIGLTNLAKDITVFDIDKRLLRFIDKAAKKYNLPIKTCLCDLTNGFSSDKYSNKFDIFLTDPTPNPISFELFLSVGLNLLKSGEGKVGYISFFPSHQKISIDFQKILTDYNVIITDMIPKFTEYDFIKETYRELDFPLLKKFDSGEKRVSFYENLTRFETISKTKRKFRVLSKQERVQILGKATKKILSNVKTDPAYKTDKDFVELTAQIMRGKIKR